MIKGGGYVSCLYQVIPHRAHKRKTLVWVRGVVRRGTQTHTMTVVA